MLNIEHKIWASLRRDLSDLVHLTHFTTDETDSKHVIACYLNMLLSVCD